VAERKTDAFTIFLGVACVALSILVLLLARENRKLKADIAAGAPEVMANALKVGERLEPFTLRSDGGETVPVRFDAQPGPSLVLVFTQTCPHCEKTFPVWRDVVQKASVPVFGVQLDRGDPAQAPQFPWPVFTPGDPQPPFLTKVPGVPATLVVAPDGTVTHVWYGELGDTERAALASAIGSRSAG
jgi:thiol-disulfide isomerase/thioredoxin